MAQKTDFGWIMSGKTNNPAFTRALTSLVSNVDIDKRTEKFRETEEVPEQERIHSLEDSECEKI